MTLTRWSLVFCFVGIALPTATPIHADELPLVTGVERQPLVAATKRLVEAMAFAGEPFSDATLKALGSAYDAGTDAECAKQIQKALDPLCVASVNINAESRVKVAAGPCRKELLAQGWRAFLVKVHNQAGINPVLVAESPNAAPTYQRGRGTRQRPRTDESLVNPEDIPNRFLDISMLAREPLTKRLSGLALEYRVILLFSRDAGSREASLSFNVGAGTQDIGFRNAVPILFQCQAAVPVTLNVRDSDGTSTTASFVVQDQQGRIYPHPARRLAPDFFFHHQVYRADGEQLLLPPGDYRFTVNRGPEYLPQVMSVKVPKAENHTVEIDLKRWIHIAKRGWYSGDHHVHAAGCAHYDSPTEGVGPDDMMRHILGEDLNVGCVLSWGPCWYTQKQFFEGEVSDLSTPDYLMRYDVEVSGFPSSHAGHLCLLKLQEDDYPGTTLLEEWPSWTLPVLAWGKKQGGVVGYSHSGWGLALPDYDENGNRLAAGPKLDRPVPSRGRAADKLPDYAMPPFDGIGANEYIVTTAHGVCDFISAVDTPAIWELNIWYHTLNCGMTTRISGETDFPCIYGDRVGLGRVYVQFDDDSNLNYDDWVEGLRLGRSYCGDGLSHILDFKVNDLGVGQVGADGNVSRIDIDQPGTVQVSFDAAAMLTEQMTPKMEAVRKRRLDQKPYWHLERCRIGDSRDVLLEVVVNGEVVATQELTADGHVENVSLPIDIDQSSWIAVRILPSVHTNPIWVHVDDKPIRASKRSAQWCLDAVEQCWKSKVNRIRESERTAARAAYDKAAAIYRAVLAECTTE
jgi:hypothetical protein